MNAAIAEQIGAALEPLCDKVETLTRTIDHHDRLIRGNNGDPGLFERLRTLEGSIGALKRVGWTVVLAMAAGAGATLWSLMMHR